MAQDPPPRGRADVKILLLNDYGTLAGGAEIQAVALREELRARGHDVRLLTSDALTSPGPLYADHTAPGSTSYDRALRQTANPSAARALKRVLDAFQPDVVHASVVLTQLSPLILPLLRRVPAVYYAVWYRSVCPTGTKMLPDGSPCHVSWGHACRRSGCLPLRDWAPLMVQMALWERWRGAFDAVVANSDATRHHLEAGRIAVNEVIGHGVRTHPSPRPLVGPPTVVFAGRLVPAKGLDVLLRAFRLVVDRVPEASLLVAGDGPERDVLESLVASLGLASHVTLLGHRPTGDLDHLFEGAWVQAVPSRWEEPFGMVAAEASMRGTAVVATDSGGLRGIVEDGVTGRLVPSGDVAAWAEALTGLLADRPLAEGMGHRGHVVAAERFGVGVQADRFLALYRRLVEVPCTEVVGSPLRPASVAI